MPSPPQLAIAVALLAIATSSYGASCVFEDWQNPQDPPDGIAVINQCQYDDESMMWLGDPVDLVQYFTAPVGGLVTGLGFLIITPSATTSMTLSLYHADSFDAGAGAESLASSILGTDYFNGIHIETIPVWGAAEFDEPAPIIAGEEYAIRLQTPSAYLFRSLTDPLEGGFLRGYPGSDLSFRVYAVPEPATAILMALAATHLMHRRRRTKSWEASARRG